MITYYTANAVLRGMFGLNNTISIAPNVYLGLSSTKPTPQGDNVTEPTGNGYQRVLIGDGDYAVSQLQKMDTPSNGSITNKSEIHFNKSTGAWLNGDLINYAVLYPSATGTNNLVAYMDLQSPIQVSGANVVPVISTGDLQFMFGYTPENPQVGE